MSNNKYFDCPAIMSDKRGTGTKMQDNDYENIKIIEDNSIKNSFEYRNFLQYSNKAANTQDDEMNNKIDQKNRNDILNFNKFGCKKIPHGEIIVNEEIDQFRLFNKDKNWKAKTYKDIFTNYKPYVV
uniref:Uncharacterized protein n=1 Tax=Megaviridae environmental sample TaxID=1737588 RepID=A0A5J6VMP0_9VIRU|nr:MAG: hypothetical protein [Megaviridae environmental sample]